MNVQRMTIKSPMDGIVVMQSIVRNGEFGQIGKATRFSRGSLLCRLWTPLPCAERQRQPGWTRKSSGWG